MAKQEGKKQKKNPLVTISMLNYNGLKHTKKCLASFMKVSYAPYELILVDNGSVDGSVEYFRKHFPTVKVVANKKNVGFCEGNNQIAKMAKGKYILILNNDTVVTPGFLKKLVDRMEADDSIGIIQPKIRQLMRPDKLDAGCSFLTNTGFLYHYGYAQKEHEKKYNREMELYSAKGACFLVRKDLIDSIGLFDTDYSAYFEETDFCHRVWLAGKRIVYDPSSFIYHLGGADNKQNPQPRIQFNSYKNRICTYLKNLSTWELVKILPIHIIFCFGIVGAFLFMGKAKISLAILRAMMWNITNLQMILKKRRVIQKKIRVVSDSSFINRIKVNPASSYYYHFLTNPEGPYKEKAVRK